MSTISETVFEQYDTKPENKALEEMQTEVRDLSRKISSFAKDAAEILSAESVANNGRKANVSLLTKQMFGVVALLTLTLNLGLYFINATLGQMIIANVGISVLHVLVSMCVVSDLAKGKTHFQNKREQIQERIQTVSEYLKELMQDRQQWVNAVSELKWLSENEQIKLQMAKLEVGTQQDKLDFTIAQVTERTTFLEGLEREQAELTRDNAKLAARSKELTEDLQIANQELDSKERDKSQVEQEITQLKSLKDDARSTLELVAQERESQESLHAEELKNLNDLKVQLQSVGEETERMNERLVVTTQSVAETEARQLQLNQTIAILTKEVEEKEIAVQANCDKSVELLTLYETLEVEKKDLVASIETVKKEFVEVEQRLRAAKDESQSLEIQIQKMQQENIELINRTVHLESQSAHQVEMLASGEAQLRGLEEKQKADEAQLQSIVAMLSERETALLDIEEILGSREAALHSIEEIQRSKEAKVQAAQEELAQVEGRVADFMQQLGELECLSVAKCISEQMPVAATIAVSEALSSAPLEVERIPEPCAACLQHQLEAANRECIEASFEDLESRQAVAQQALEESLKAAEDVRKQVADSEQRVEMLVRKANGLSDQVQERSAELYGLKQELIVTRSEVRELEAAKQQLSLAEQELLSLQTNIEQNEADLDSLQTRMENLDQEYRDKANTARDLDHHLAELQLKRDEALSEISASSFELEGLRTTNAELVLQCALLEERASHAMSEQNDTHDDLADLQEKMDAARIALQSLTEQRNQQTLELEELSDAVDVQRGQLSEIESEVKDLSVQRQALQDLELEVEDVQQYLEALRAEGQAVALEVKENQQLVDSNENRIQELLHESNTLEEKNAVAADRLKSISDEVADAQTVSQQWQSYLSSLQADMQVCSDRKASLEKEVDLLQTQIASGLLRTQDLNDSLDAIQEDCQLAQEQFGKEDQRLRDIQTEAEEALSKRDWLVSQQNELQRVLGSLQGELSETEQTLARTVLQREEEQARLLDGQSRRADLESTILGMQADQVRLSDELNVLKCESESLTRLNETSREACERLERQIDSLEMVKANLQQVETDYNERRSAVGRLDSELSDLQSKCRQLQSEIQALESKNLDLVQLEQACETKQSLLLTLQKEYEDKLRVRQEIDAEIASMKSTQEDLARLQIDCNDSRSCLSQMMEDQKAKETILLEIRQELDAKRCELSEIQNSLTGKKLQLEDLDEGIAAKSLESEELVHQLDQSRRELGKLAAFRKSTEVTIGELMQQVDSLQEAIEVCHHDVRNAESSRAEMVLQIATMESEVRAIMNDRAQLTGETTLANVLLESKRSELSAIRLQIDQSVQESVTWMQSVQQLEVDFQLASLELEAKRQEIKAVMVEAVFQPDLPTDTQREDEIENEVESKVEMEMEEASLALVSEVQPPSLPPVAMEEDVWNSLNELTQLGQSVRVDDVHLESVSQVDGQVIVPRNSSTLQPSSKPRADAWASIFSNDN